MNNPNSITSMGKNANLFIVGQTISRIGDMAQLVGLSMYVYKASNNIFAVSCLYAVEAFSMIIFGQIGGLFADRMERKTSLITLQLSQAALIALVPFVGKGVLLYILFFIFTACTSVSRIFQSAISGDVVNRAHYEKFQATYSSLQSSAIIIGPVIGAWIFTVLGTTAMFIFNSLSFVICALCILSIHLPKSDDMHEIPNTWKKHSSWGHFAEGYKIIFAKSELAAVVFSMPIVMFAVGILNSIFIGISSTVWLFSDKQFGWIMGASGIGGLFGGFLYGKIHARFAPKNLFYSGIMLKTLCLLLAITTKNFAVVFLLLTLNSIGFSVMGATARIFFLKATLPLERGRVSGIAESLACILMLCGSSASGFLVTGMGYKISIVVVAAFHLLCAFSFWQIGRNQLLQPQVAE